jgi:type IV fimbrial biogenesis protein FimT
VNASANDLPLKRQTTSSGFTLIELMVTIAVLAIIVSIAAPNISTQLANQRVKSTAATLANALKEAKVESVIRRQPLLLSFNNSNKIINVQYIVSGQVKTTIASYSYDVKSTIKSATSSNSNEFKPNKVAEVATYTICDRNNTATPINITVSATSVISNRPGGTCP